MRKGTISNGNGLEAVLCHFQTSAYFNICDGKKKTTIKTKDGWRMQDVEEVWGPKNSNKKLQSRLREMEGTLRNDFKKML